MYFLKQLWTSLIKAPIYLLFCGLSLIPMNYTAEAAPTKKGWQETPKADDWSAFIAKDEKGRLKDWSQIKSLGLGFEDLSWEWRLGWVRTCATASSKECGNIMQLGLFDKALVVRAESASRLGDRFAGTGHSPVIRLLQTAYSIHQNKRHKEPMYVQFRILRALNQIGGEGITIGKQLSLNSNPTSQYWSRIASK